MAPLPAGATMATPSPLPLRQGSNEILRRSASYDPLSCVRCLLGTLVACDEPTAPIAKPVQDKPHHDIPSEVTVSRHLIEFVLLKECRRCYAAD
jgi:hypothetical protein